MRATRPGARRLALRVAAVVAAILTPATASATYVSSSSSSFGLSENLTVTTAVGAMLTATISPVNPVSGTAPPAYNLSQSVASFTSTVTGVETTSTGVIVDTAFSDALTGGVTKASSTVNDLNLGVVPNPIAALTLVSLTATTVQSTAQVTGDFGAIVTSGTTILTNPVLSILGVNIALSSNPAPNTTVDLTAAGLAGVTLILNERILGGDGITTATITTNAIHLRFTATPLGGGATINGDVIVAQSMATLLTRAVPEPASVALLGVGAALLGVARLRAGRARSRA